ncbi:benzyl alcohol o-benzoyltransferase [Quercus suber]|uniref:Benzyl alcohol o-benzoyltransferase n=1 Tax=Quercus suber TaxID=58331 RepID=A0AAW0L8Q1_QUESU
MFCRYDQSLEGKDPVKVIREAIARTLVFYYPYAGRLREGPDAKFMVECTGEGVMFIEADADVTLEEFGDAPHPPFPCVDELIFEVPVFEVPGSGGLVNCPLLLFQVTRLRCGGFALALRYNHIMSDGMSILQFMIAVGEMAQGASAPSIPPVWQRELLNARNPPQISAIRKKLPHHLHKSSTFDVLTACLWRCRTIAIQLDSEDEVRLIFAINLCQNPLEFALELIKSAKNNVTEEYVRSLIDLLVIKGPPFLTMVHSYFVSDITRTRFEALDFGLGKAAFGGPGKIFPEPGLDPANNYMPMKNSQGDEEIMVPMCLPTLAIERFVKELDSILGDH